MHIVDKSFTRVVFDPNGPVKIAVIYDRDVGRMRCVAVMIAQLVSQNI